MVVFAAEKAADVWELVHGRQSKDSTILPKLSISRASSSPGPVLIFTAAADPDALAAVRTLTALLKSDLVRYEVHPVSGYAMLREKFDLLVRGDAAIEPRSVLCINCGAMVDIETVLGLSEDSTQDLDEVSDARIFVLDPHRPFHLRNVGSKRVILFDGIDSAREGQVPISLNWEDEWGNLPDDHSSDEDDDTDDDNDESDSESDLGSDDEEETDEANEDDEGQPNPSSSASPSNSEDKDEASTESPPRKRARHGSNSAPSARDVERDAYLAELDNDDVAFDERGVGDSDEEEGQIRKGGRNRRSIAPKKKRRRTRRSRSRMDDPEMEERERVREYYSNATVSTSSALISHAIADLMKRSNIDTLWMAIIGTTSQKVFSYANNELYEETLPKFRGAICQLQANDSDPNTSRVQNVGYAPYCNSGASSRIAENTEYRLDLLRHWTLYDSLLHSSYTATRLAAWRQTGRRRLLEILATLGIPLKESQQKWCYMKQHNKRAFEDNFEKAIKRFDLGDAFTYDGFIRTLPGHRGDISASDYVHAVTALLEFDDPSETDARGNVSHSILDRFWRGYDALDPRKTNLLEAGLEMAICAQRLTADTGGDVIERRKFVPSGPFRYVFLRDQQFKGYLTHPLLLRRLALFLKNALLRQGARDKPFIILAPDSSRNKWIAVAATTDGQRNDFGHRFMKAAERNGSEVTYAGFDASVCEITEGQEIEFVRFLHDVMR